MPIFPEVRPYLESAWEQAEDGAVEGVPRCKSGAVNLRTRLLAIIEQAGLSPWPMLFQNLRSSAETELVESFPVHVVCAWIGNTPKVASEHYLQVTNDHIKAAQNPARATLATTSIAPHSAPPANEKPLVLSNLSGKQGAMEPVEWARQNSKDSLNAGKNEDSRKSGAKSGAVPSRSQVVDESLIALIEAWPQLDANTKTAIIALVVNR